MDGALLSHPGVAEAVSFSAPDEKYGEVVAAAVVLTEAARGQEGIKASIIAHASQRLSAFKARLQARLPPLRGAGGRMPGGGVCCLCQGMWRWGCLCQEVPVPVAVICGTVRPPFPPPLPPMPMCAGAC